MYHTEARVFINRPIEIVFDAVADVPSQHEWQDGLVESGWTSAQTKQVGATYKFVSQMGGVRWDLPGQIIHWDAPHGWRWQASEGPFPVQGGYRLEVADGGTWITMYSDSEPSGWMRWMRSLLKWMGERSYQKSLCRLKALLEL